MKKIIKMEKKLTKDMVLKIFESASDIMECEKLSNVNDFFRNTFINDFHGIDKKQWFFAFYCGCKNVVLNLLKNTNIDVNLRDHLNETALHKVAETGDIDILKILLEQKNIDPNLENIKGRKALHIASRNNYFDIVKILEKY